MKLFLRLPHSISTYSLSRHLSLMANNTIAVCQFTGTSDKKQNLETVQSLVAQAAATAKVIFLPEACDYVTSSDREIKLLAESLDGPLMNEYKSLAQKHKVCLSIGGFHELREVKGKEVVHNSHVLINEQGVIIGTYRKMHLFEANLPESNVSLRESDFITAGSEIVAPIHTSVGAIGLMICYDLRFPELSVILRKMGADILTFPSAFTVPTGQAHWKTLLRSRAIENQCYVVASAQYGVHNDKRMSYGNALIINPWGEIIAECPPYSQGITTNQCIAYANIDIQFLNSVRQKTPVFNHRRDDLYTLHQNEGEGEHCTTGYMFSDKVIPASTVFYTTSHSFAFTNIRCVVPGHVLVASLRKVKRLEGLRPIEIADLFQTVVKIQQLVEQVYGSQSSTICVQDGPEAGQTVPHVHCHILPRKSGDFKRNDDIYLQLAKHDRNDENEPIRSLEEMISEANTLREQL